MNSSINVGLESSPEHRLSRRQISLGELEFRWETVDLPEFCDTYRIVCKIADVDSEN